LYIEVVLGYLTILSSFGQRASDGKFDRVTTEDY